MIEFNGKLSSKCKKYLIDDSWRLNLTVGFTIGIPLIVLTLILSFKYGWIYLLIFIPIALIMFFISLKPSTKAYRFFYGKDGEIYDGELQWNIIIDQDLISAEGTQRSETNSLDDIKEVVDFGDFYKIYFYFPHKSNLFICQKDLITQGTIEEFEAMFEGKIIRKIIK
ncbi:MAG: hypothetical protein J6N93_02750 [Clostridia bacterium]|nr:hypothetical protein [Clostridia bacterium]